MILGNPMLMYAERDCTEDPGGWYLALLALSRQSLCHGTTLQIDVPGTALCSAQAIHVPVQIK